MSLTGAYLIRTCISQGVHLKGCTSHISQSVRILEAPVSYGRPSCGACISKACISQPCISQACISARHASPTGKCLVGGGCCACDFPETLICPHLSVCHAVVSYAAVMALSSTDPALYSVTSPRSSARAGPRAVPSVCEAKPDRPSPSSI
jgi:hypothetical protein